VANNSNLNGVFSNPTVGTVFEVDTAKMSASAIISTPAVDRVGDSMDPLGCDLTQYRLNPVVFWNHAFDGFTKPIGISENSSGELQIFPSGENIKATCYFTNKFLEAEQIFDLVNEKTIRATSIRFDPIGSPSRSGGVQRFSKWYLLEWSWVPIGCNPEAVQQVLAKGYLAGRRISSGITKSLELLLPEKKLQIAGYNFKKDAKMRFVKSCDDNKKCNCDKDPLGGEVKMTNDKERPEDAPPPGTKPAPMPPSSGYSSAPPAAGKTPPPGGKVPPQSGRVPPQSGKPGEEEYKGNMDEESESEDIAGDGEEAETPKAYGAQLVEAAYNALNEVRVNIKEGSVALEHPEIEALIATTLEALGMMMSEVEAAYAKSYVRNPKYNYSPLASSGRRLDWHDNLKSFLAGGASNRFAVSGIAERIRSVAKSGTVSGREADVLKSCATQLQGFVESARSNVRHESNGVVGDRLESITKSSDATLAILKNMKR
jgi:hypothetical protein